MTGKIGLAVDGRQPTTREYTRRVSIDSVSEGEPITGAQARECATALLQAADELNKPESKFAQARESYTDAMARPAGKGARNHSYYEMSKHDLRRERVRVAGRVLLACLVAVTAVMIVLAFRDENNSVERSAAPVASSAGMSAPFVDGQLQFSVQTIESSEAPLGAQSGPVHVVVVSVTNTGSSPQLVSLNDQMLLGDQGREWPPDPELLTQLNNGKQRVLLAPGDAMTIRLPFVLPVNTEPVAVALKAGPELPGVPIPAR